MSFGRKFKRKKQDVSPTISHPTTEDSLSAANTPKVFPTHRGFAFIMPCMNRRDHAEQSVAELMKDPRIDGIHNHLVFVDFYCPGNTGAVLKEKYGDRIHVLSFQEMVPIEEDQVPYFQKPLAHNSGAFEALVRFSPHYLIFMDADTLVTPQLMDFIFHHASPDRFLIFKPSHEAQRDLTGFLVVHSRAFTRVNGFDTRFTGWGAEDLDLRVKLLIKGLAPYYDSKALLRNPSLYMRWTEIPYELAHAIPHTDERRTLNYEEKSKNKSHQKNMDLLCSNIYEWLGVHPNDLQYTPLSSNIQRLIGMDLFINPKSYE